MVLITQVSFDQLSTISAPHSPLSLFNSTGGIAGIAIGVAILGLLIGVVVGLFMFKVR